MANGAALIVFIIFGAVVAISDLSGNGFGLTTMQHQFAIAIATLSAVILFLAGCYTLLVARPFLKFKPK